MSYVAQYFLVTAEPRQTRPLVISKRTSTLLIITMVLLAISFALAPLAIAKKSTTPPNFGENVYIFNPSMPLSQIQSTVDSIATQQLSNQFGTQRYALLFEPGTYGSSTTPLNFQVGYYTRWRASASRRAMWSSTGPSTSTTSARTAAASRW